MRALGDRRFPWLLAARVCGAAGALPAGAAGAGAHGAGRCRRRTRARGWSRIHAAASSGNYQGTLVFSADGALSSRACRALLRRRRRPTRRVEALDGRSSSVVPPQRPRAHAVAAVARGGGREARAAGAGRSPQPVIEPRRWSSYELRSSRQRRTWPAARRRCCCSSRATPCALRSACGPTSRTGLMLRADVLGPAPSDGAGIDARSPRSRSTSSRSPRRCCSR